MLDYRAAGHADEVACPPISRWAVGGIACAALWLVIIVGLFAIGSIWRPTDRECDAVLLAAASIAIAGAAAALTAVVRIARSNGTRRGLALGITAFVLNPIIGAVTVAADVLSHMLTGLH